MKDGASKLGEKPPPPPTVAQRVGGVVKAHAMDLVALLIGVAVAGSLQKGYQLHVQSQGPPQPKAHVTITVVGDRVSFPVKGSEVAVHYTGTLEKRCALVGAAV